MLSSHYVPCSMYLYIQWGPPGSKNYLSQGREQESIHKMWQRTTSSGGSSTLISIIEMSLTNCVGLTSWVALNIRPKFGLCLADMQVMLPLEALKKNKNIFWEKFLFCL